MERQPRPLNQKAQGKDEIPKTPGWGIGFPNNIESDPEMPSIPAIEDKIRREEERQREDREQPSKEIYDYPEAPSKEDVNEKDPERGSTEINDEVDITI